LEWRNAAAENHDFAIEGIGRELTFIELQDALFRTNSCVVLPEGEAPSSGEHASITSVGVFATALRFNQEQPGKKFFIAGHTDTTNTIDFNQKLSNERAQCALALLLGDRDSFAQLADARHAVGDYKQILSFASKAFSDLAVGSGGFTCDPGKVDDVAATGEAAVRIFQGQYNQNKQAIGATAADLAVDGSVGPLTWGALFDVLEFALQRELGETKAGVAALRDNLVWVDDSRKALGFSEHFPVDKVGRDGVRSQANRRVELLSFDLGEEPDLVLAESDPDVSDLYLPGNYQRTPLQPPKTALGMRSLRLFLLGADGLPSSNAPYRLRTASQLRQGVSGPNGEVSEDAVFADATCEIEWGTANDSASTPIFPNYAEIFLNTAAEDADAELANRQLFNLGYWHDDIASRRQAFLSEYNEPDSTDPSVNVAHATGKPKQQRILG
jgi:hypothetical protein